MSALASLFEQCRGIQAEAAGLGILKVDGDDRIVDVIEKPGGEGLTTDFCVRLPEERYLASMGIYVFNFAALTELLQELSDIDFGHHVIPKAIHTHRVFSSVFRGYWKDIGTIGSFWQANLELTRRLPLFSMYDEEARIYTRPRYLPSSQIHSCNIQECLISEGVIISATRITGSAIGLRSIIRSGSTISDSIVMGNDFFEPKNGSSSCIPLVLWQVSDGVRLRRNFDFLRDVTDRA